MAIFVDWWRKRKISHIQQTVTHENIRAKASAEGLVPQITLSWRVVNRSMVDVTVSRISGELYVGAWRLANFDSDKFIERHVGYAWQPTIVIGGSKLKKNGGETEIVVTLFPPLEFWVMRTFRCSLHNTTVEVKCADANVSTVVSKEDLPIENGEPTGSQYLDSFKNRVLSMWRPN